MFLAYHGSVNKCIQLVIQCGWSGVNFYQVRVSLGVQQNVITKYFIEVIGGLKLFLAPGHRLFFYWCQSAKQAFDNKLLHFLPHLKQAQAIVVSNFRAHILPQGCQSKHVPVTELSTKMEAYVHLCPSGSKGLLLWRNFSELLLISKLVTWICLSLICSGSSVYSLTENLTRPSS